MENNRKKYENPPRPKSFLLKKSFIANNLNLTRNKKYEEKDKNEKLQKYFQPTMLNYFWYKFIKQIIIVVFFKPKTKTVRNAHKKPQN